jgi:hypothetical protein
MADDQYPLWANPPETENGYDSRRSNNACIQQNFGENGRRRGKREAGLGAVRRFFFPAAQNQVRKATARVCFARTVDPAPRTSGRSC